ncbi:DUF4884 domain-containing protein [Sphingobacterium sp. InxBP1]|uniref:DUF4884 domain-containing protein n=1 Tax=Sphingobacterium sp. InxBP1 TaxID=2870328 RepID=UPI002242E358|nr:DUF4884 domain-containing protein [Sphingobacterium sp. InxBP1]MCW8311454.1 DUF4884 domain-containing protein [Sphingobacterium sp. InxBP1]
MKIISKILLAIAIVALLSLVFSCGKDAIKSEQTNNRDIELELLFEKDGCKVYRFYDGMYYVYWSNCSGRTEYNYRVKSGNTTVTRKQQTICN